MPSSSKDRGEPPAKAPVASRRKARRRVFSLRFILAATFGTLVAISVGAVLTISVMANFANTYSLLNERAVQLLNGMEGAIRKETSQASTAVSAIAELFRGGAFEIGDAAAIDRVARTILLSNNVVEGIFVFDLQGKPVALLRGRDGAIAPPGPDILTDQAVSAMNVGPVRVSGKPIWGQPVDIGNVLYHVVSQSLVRDGEIRGVVVAAIGRNTMNRVVSDIGKSNATVAFVLNGANEVIANSRITRPFDQSQAIPIDRFPDPALAEFPRATRSDEFGSAEAEGIDVYNSSGRSGYVFITKQLPGYAQQPYTLGAYFRKADIGAEIFRTIASMIAGIAFLVLAVAAAIWLGRTISRPMLAISNTAESLSKFDLDAIEPLPRSRILEIDHQANALNRMTVAMREFSRYVPRPLVARLIRTGAAEEETVEREITILFTDIVGFTSLSERLDAQQTAEFLNNHFNEVCGHIEQLGGTVDKFMGDSVMAFWRAPERDPDHARHGVQAAREIAEAIAQGNVARRLSGKSAIRLRMGLHTGRAVAGNIGGGGRQNYTIVGDAVNVAQRLEQIGKEIMRPQEEVLVLVSQAVVEAVGQDARFSPAGTRVLRGRERPVSISRLDLGDVTKVLRFPEADTA